MCKDQIDGVSGLELELIAFMGMYDRHKWVELAGWYDSFAKAVDCHGDFRPIRLNVADLLDEILFKHNGDFVRERLIG